MCSESDKRLASECQGVLDMILGGHDHMSFYEQIGSIALVKSGADFKEFSDITVGKDRRIKHEKVVITGDIDQDAETQIFVEKCSEVINATMG
jgi:2',3'-cyclic-nucleotide 2'-phosphodiesterase (5'-nucleotidase family)